MVVYGGAVLCYRIIKCSAEDPLGCVQFLVTVVLSALLTSGVLHLLGQSEEVLKALAYMDTEFGIPASPLVVIFSIFLFLSFGCLIQWCLKSFCHCDQPDVKSDNTNKGRVNGGQHLYKKGNDHYKYASIA